MILEATIVQPAANFQYAQFGQQNQRQQVYHHAPNQQVVMQPMAMQGQPRTQMMMTGPQIPNSYMQQPISQANQVNAFYNTAPATQLAQASAPSVSNTTVPNTQSVAQASLPSEPSQTLSELPPPYSPEWTK